MNQNQNNNQPKWEQVAGGGSNNERWAPQKNLNYNANDPGNSIIGYLKDISERPGANGPFSVAEIVTVDPNTRSLAAAFDVAGGKVLDDMLNDIPLGTFICIKFTGKARSKSGNTYNTWEVFQDKNAIPFSQLGGHVKTQNTNAPAFSNNAGTNNAPNFNQGQQQGFQQQQQNTSAPVFNNTNAPFSQNNSPNFNQGQSNAPVFQQQGQNNTPNFQQQTGTSNFNPNAGQNNQQQIPTFNPNANQNQQQGNPQNGMFGGQKTNDPFAGQQQNDDLPY